MTDGVHTFQMACDGAIAQKLVNADVLHTEVDISTFGTYHMQAIVLHAAWIVRKGVDWNLLLAITSLLSLLPAISIGDKIVREFKDDDGKRWPLAQGEQQPRPSFWPAFRAFQIIGADPGASMAEARGREHREALGSAPSQTRTVLEAIGTW